MSAPRRLHLGLWLLTSGQHAAGWRHPDFAPEGLFGLEHYVQAARIAEAGKLDMVFFEDTLAARERNGGIFGEVAPNSLDPVVQIAALAGATEQIGLAASYSTTYHSPRMLAAKFAAVDQLSGGRAGWNMVTSGAAAGRNFGSAAHPDHATRYGGAHKVVEEVLELWRGAAMPRSPQGRPVLIQAGMSEQGLDFASSYGEGIFASFKDLDAGRTFRTGIRERARAKGRDPDGLKVMPGFLPIVGSTTAEAEEKAEFYRELIHPRIRRGMLGERFNIDFSGYGMDDPFPTEEVKASLEDRPNIGGDRGRFLAEVEPGDTVGTYCERMVRKPTTHLSVTGGPEEVADMMQTWLEAGGCDGFILLALQIPLELQVFVDEVVPVLQRRGLFRTAYEGTTLRSHLGLGAPPP